MKYLTLIAMLLLSAKATAQAFEEASQENPQHITQIRDGKTHTYDGDEWIVVKKRKPGPKPAPKPSPEPKIVEKIVEKTVTVEKTVLVEKEVFQRNRLTVLVGEAPREGIETYHYGATMEARTRVGAVGALQYQYSFTRHWSGALQLETNPGAMIGVGYGW